MPFLRTSLPLLILASSFLTKAQKLEPAQTGHQTIALFPKGAPNAQGTAPEDIPTLTLYPVSGKDVAPTAIVVCPGGGYARLSMAHEGYDVAEWLNQQGISAFVLKYRLGPKYKYPNELLDAQRAIRWVRSHANDYGYKEDQIGIWGFSAGGHLASTAGTHFDTSKKDPQDDIDKRSSRPDFMVLAYPVITMKTQTTHQGSLRNLLGESPDPVLVTLLSNELQVTSKTPPAFLFHTTEDPVVPVENSISFYLAMRKAGVPAEMHIYLKGHHGVGLATKDPVLRTWTGHLLDWLKVNNLR
jgi:acetyl esterase/lipase